ncbi:uncharacterized protein K452DRAFT_315168 [Aplosporella prunicola CBS 121167]|uniref:Terpene synthase n=1 Tax=Aplosporella prunicola CBS 121167 TaxID=1176127 RepID=A0A6A6BSB5_9PEZI|nr:uncharacterized protein K452DRAFT_315168 [Aplosporella prunicola CBS 121167]KAF2146989.1 hypothetical protein K452DRAFT_315168 [Aplosporella prunicola CBS 121167]
MLSTEHPSEPGPTSLGGPKAISSPVDSCYILRSIPSRLVHKRHPLEPQVTADVEGWFLQHWPFENEKARKKIGTDGYSYATCMNFPLALDDRIHSACRLITILFLIDDLLEDMSFDDGKAYNEHLMPIMSGTAAPNPSIPCEWMMHEIWEEMRKSDPVLTEQMLEPTFDFMRAQTEKSRIETTGLGRYLEYRERDVGGAFLLALQRYAMNLHLSPAELESVHPLEQICSKHLAVMNDVYSFDKELQQAEMGHLEGSCLCNGVKVLADESGLDYEASKRVLALMCREWEVMHKELEKKSLNEGCGEHIARYISGLEYQMSGNEYWSEKTQRYNKK